MQYKIIKRFYSEVQANIYFIRLKESGIKCFLSSENMSSVLPLGDGGFMLNVALDQFEDAVEIIHLIDQEQKENIQKQDFREATKEDILYEKQVAEYESWLNSGWVNKKMVSFLLLVLFMVVIIIIIDNYYSPFVQVPK